MASSAALVELGDRYAALGLTAAARAVFERALGEAGGEDPAAARRLAELALQAGDAAVARAHAQAAVAKKGGPAARLLLGRAQLSAGELSAARFSFAQVLDAPAAGALTKVRALCGRAQVALAEADRPGGVATCLAALDELDRYAAAPGRRPEELEAELALADDAVVLAVAAGAGAEIRERLAASSAPSWWRALLGA